MVVGLGPIGIGRIGLAPETVPQPPRHQRHK